MSDPNDPDAGKCFCCTNPMKDFCKKFICFISCVAIVISILLGGYGYTSLSGQSFNPEMGEYKTSVKIPSNNVVAALCLVGCIFGVLIGALGLCLCKWPNPCFSIVYFILAFISGLIAFIAGGAIMSGQVSENFKEVTCKTEVPGLNGKTGEVIATEQYSKLVDNLMCTRTCVCDKTSFDVKYATYNDTQLVPRTKAGMKTAGKDGFKTWIECYDKTISKATGASNCPQNPTEDDYASGCEIDATSSEFKEFVKKGGVKFLQDFEKKFKCAGLCKTPLFYLSKPLSDGKPTRDCVTAFQEEYGSSTIVGVVALFTGIILLMASFGAIPLCTDYNKLEEE